MTCRHIIKPENGQQFMVASAGMPTCPWCEIERLRDYACHKIGCAALHQMGAKCDCGLSELVGPRKVDENKYECETCKDDPIVCASIPGLRHCEKATR